MTELTNLTTEVVELPGVEPADPPTEMLPGRLWHGGCPVDYDWARTTGIRFILDLADEDAHPPTGATAGLLYVKAPLVDADDLPDPEFTTRQAHLAAGIIAQGYPVLVQCTFGRNSSGLLVSLVVRVVLRVCGSEDLAHVQARRRGTVNNDTFAAWLRSLPAPD